MKSYHKSKYAFVGSKIKYLVDEDKPLMPTQIDYGYYDEDEEEEKEDQDEIEDESVEE